MEALDYIEQMETAVFIAVFLGLMWAFLSLVFFIKLWVMTDDVSEIRKILENNQVQSQENTDPQTEN